MARQHRQFDEDDLEVVDTKQARAMLKHLAIDPTTSAEADAIDAFNCANADALADYSWNVQSKGWDYA